MSHEMILCIVFAIVIPMALWLDLGVFHRTAHKVKVKEALLWSAVWISLALLFGIGIYLMLGTEKALNFITGYLVEESLSVDNLFVFLLIFTYFCVPDRYQHRVLFWGIVGAIVMRGIFIATGITLLENFHWVIYIFGAFLVYTGIKIATQEDKKLKPENNPVLRLFRKFVPITKRYHGDSFTKKAKGRRLATPLLMVLIVIETTDIIFAMDSVPAVLAITRDPFIVYTSNIFAILGLRALYFALASVIQRLRYLNFGLAVILVFLGIKMIISSDFFHVHIPVGISLLLVMGILTISAIASLIRPEKNPNKDSAGEE